MSGQRVYAKEKLKPIVEADNTNDNFDYNFMDL